MVSNLFCFSGRNIMTVRMRMAMVVKAERLPCLLFFLVFFFGNLTHQLQHWQIYDGQMVPHLSLRLEGSKYYFPPKPINIMRIRTMVSVIPREERGSSFLPLDSPDRQYFPAHG